MRHRLLGLVIALTFGGHCAAASAQIGAPSEGLIDQLMAALPNSDSLRHPPDPPSAAPEQTRLQGLNLGHEAEVSAVMRDWLDCVRPLVVATTNRTIRQIIRELGARKAGLLLQFYGGPDYRRLLALGLGIRAHRLSAAEQREFLRIMSTYPLEEFATRIDNLNQVIARDPSFLPTTLQCSALKQAALDRQGLRYR